MPLCAAGSEPKAGVATSLVITPAYVQSILPSVLSALYPYLPWMQGLSIGDVATFCASDPPLTWTVPSAEDFISFLDGGVIGDFIAVNQFLRDLTRSYLWYTLCKCSDGSTPTPLTPPTLPDLPAVNPPNAVTPSPVGACASYDSLVVNVNDGAGARYDLIGSGGHGGSPTYVPFPTGATRLDWTFTQYTVGSDNLPSLNRVVIRKADGTFTSAFPENTTGATTSGTLAVAAGATGFYVDGAQEFAGTPSTDQISATVRIYCGAEPGQTASPCCPPDPIATGMLSQLLNLVTLIQRQNAPFAYVPGATHSGLTGNGEISVSGLIGAKITSTVPGRTGVELGDPDVLFDIGWVNWGSADGFAPRERLTTSPQLSFPSRAAQYTKIGYSLPADVTISILELIREP